MPFLFLPLAVVLIFLLTKSLTVGVRLSDTNIYIAIADALNKGEQLYTDIFFTNAPLYPQISRVYLWLAGGSAERFYFAAPLEAAAIACLLFLIHKSRSIPLSISVLSPVLYLGSFLVLSTTDHATGVFTAMLFMTGGWLAAEHKKHALSGILHALAIATKAYTLPITIGFAVWYAVGSREGLCKYLTTLGAGIIILITPTLLTAYNAFLSQTIGYSLGRAAGVDKGMVALFFAASDWFLLAGGIWALVLLGKLRMRTGPEGYALAMQILFLLFYKDVYFFYLNTLLPFATAGTCLMIFAASRRFDTGGMVAGITVALFAVALSVSTYFGGGYHELQRIRDLDRLVAAVNRIKPDALYGDADFTPAVAYQTGIPFLGGLIDTNLNLYRSNRYSAAELTSLALEGKTAVLTYGASYPEQGVDAPVATEIVLAEKITSSCVLTYAHPILSESGLNRISVWQCPARTD